MIGEEGAEDLTIVLREDRDQKLRNRQKRRRKQMLRTRSVRDRSGILFLPCAQRKGYGKDIAESLTRLCVSLPLSEGHAQKAMKL